MKPGVLAIPIALVLGWGSAALAMDRSSDRLPDRPLDAEPLQVLRLALDLTDDQVVELRTLLQARADATGPIAEEIGMLQRQMEEILRSDVHDPLAVGEIVLDIRALQAEMGQIQAAFRTNFNALLSPDQHQRIAQINRIALANRAAEALTQLRLRP